MLAIAFVLLTASYTVTFVSVERFRGDKRGIVDIAMGRESTPDAALAAQDAAEGKNLGANLPSLGAGTGGTHGKKGGLGSLLTATYPGSTSTPTKPKKKKKTVKPVLTSLPVVPPYYGGGISGLLLNPLTGAGATKTHSQGTAP